MRLSPCRLLSSWLACLLVVSAVGAAEPTDSIPSDVAVLARLKSPKTATDKIVNLAAAVDPDAAATVRVLTQSVGTVIANPAMVGVDDQKDWWIAVFASVDSEPQILYAVPVTDATAARESTIGSFEFLEKGNWLLYSESAELLERIKGTSPEANASRLMSKDSQRLFDEGDLGVYVNLDSLKVIYAEALNSADAQLGSLLDQVGNAAPEIPGMNFRNLLQVYEELGQGALQLVRDSHGFTVAMTWDDAGIGLAELLHVDAESDSMKTLKQHQAAELSLISRLPADQPVYFGFHVDMPSLMDFWVAKGGKIFADNEGYQKLLKKMQASMREIEFGQYLTTVSIGKLDENGALEAINLVEAKPAKQLQTVMSQTAEGMVNLNVGGIRQESTLTKDAEKIGNQTVDLFSVKMIYPDDRPGVEFQQQIIEWCYGKDGLVSRMAYLDHLMVQTTGGGKATMERALQALDASITSDSTVTIARGQLLEKANLIVLLDLPNLIVDVVSAISESGQLPIPVDPETLRGLEIPASYLGTSIGTDSAGIRFKTHLSRGQLVGFAKLAALVQEMQRPDL